MRVVILDQEERARGELRAVLPALEANAEIRTGQAPNAVLREAGDDTGILPYARSVTADGVLCAKWLGRLTLTRARSLLAACSSLTASPPRSRS
ncbi:MAG: hypothetical protein JSR90_11550 [Proteobacteria bacterium]|nr:hypothetical protein [Pseudomonadota bacterium]